MQERQKLNMEIEIGQFYIWKETNNIKAKEILLWHALMYLSCSAGWVKWISTPISTLESKTGLKRDAIYSARDNLKKLGRIEVLPGKGSKAAQYRIVPFIDNCCQDEDDLYTEDENPSIDTDESTDIPPQEPPKEPQEEPKKVNIFRRIQTIIPMPSTIDIDTIRSYLEDGMENELLIEAVNISERELQGKKPTDKWRYAKGIMRNWFNDGVKTISQYQENEKAREEMVRSGGNKQNNKHVPGRKDGTLEVSTGGMREFRVPGDD